MPQLHHRTCNICEAMCGLIIEHEGPEILSIKGDPKDPLSKGHICPKAVALQDFYHDQDRLKKPIRKTKDGWEEMEWEAAFDLVASNIKSIQEANGKNAFASYIGNPNAHNLGNIMNFPTFFRALGTKNRYSSASADQLPHHVASNYMLGHGMLIPVPDIDRTDFLLIIGGNPLVSNGSMMSAPGYGKRMKAIQKRGGKVVVVDPRRTETARKADEHIFIKPERDALLLLGMVHTLFAEDLVDLRHLAPIIQGVEEVRTAVKDYSPEKVADPSGIPAETIRKLAREMANAESAVCYSRMGASTQSFGGLCQWLTNVFNILSGNFDRPGGAMFTQPAVDYVKNTSHRKKPSSYGRYQSRVRNLPYNSGEFPVAVLAEEIMTEGEGQIKGLITIAGNPVLSSPDGKALDEAFDSLEFMVSIDIYLNETTRHADIILPATTGLEVSHYDVLFHVFAVQNTAKYSPPMFERKAEQRHDWEILQALAERLSEAPVPRLHPDMMLDMALQAGPYDLSLDQLKEHPHGLDLGPLRSCLADRLTETPDEWIHLAPDLFVADLKRLEDRFFSQEHAEPDYLLIGRRLLRSHNTWTQNSHRLIKGKNPCTLIVHPEDAAQLSIEDGQFVQVSSETGTLKIEVEISDEIMPGVVSLPQGWGHNRKRTKMNVAATQPGVSINDLTDRMRVDQLTGNAAFNGLPVHIQTI